MHTDMAKLDTDRSLAVSEKCKQEVYLDPAIICEYDQTKKNIDIRTQLHELMLSSFNLGVDINPLETYQVWSSFSSSWGCPGWMDIPEDVDQRRCMLNEAITKYLKLTTYRSLTEGSLDKTDHVA